MATGRPGVIYLQKDRLHLYSPFLQQIVELRFPSEVVRDSDVLNPESLEVLIKTFVTNGKIQPSSIYIVLADNAYFVKDFVMPAPPPAQKGAPAQPLSVSMETLHVMSMDFVEHVPYENVVSKTIPLKNGLKVIAASKDYFDAVGHSFEKVGFSIAGVFPGIVLGNNLSAKPVLDGSIVNAVISKAGGLKEFDLLNQEVYKPEPKEGAETTVDMELEDFEKNKKPDKKRLYAMLGIMGFLLIVLVFVYINSNQPVQQQQQSNNQVVAPTVAQPTPVVSTAAPTSGSGPAIDPEEAKLLTVQLTNASAPAISFEKLRTAIGSYGFANVTSQSQPSVSSGQTIIIFSLAPSAQMKAAVLLEVKKITPNVQVQEKTDASTDITILLGR